MPAAEAAAPVSTSEASALFADLADASSLVLAVSGGPDSTALLLLAARWCAARGRAPRLLAVTVDHGLRREAAGEARAVKRLAHELGVDHRTVRWTGPKPATGIQEAARAARYRLLGAAAGRVGARHLLTGHTLDDQAETVLFRLARGSGLSGLAGMARRTAFGDRVVVRPFLDLPKARLIATVTAAGLSHAEDPANADLRFSRGRWRRIAPLLAAEGLDAPCLARLARRMSRADRALAGAAQDAFGRLVPTETSSRPIAIDRQAFLDLPEEIALRVLGHAVGLRACEGPVELAKLETLAEAVRVAETKASCTRLRRTLAGAIVTVDARQVIVDRAPPRRTRPASVNRAVARTPDEGTAAGGRDCGTSGHSLGREAPGTYIGSRLEGGPQRIAAAEPASGSMARAAKDIE